MRLLFASVVTASSPSDLSTSTSGSATAAQVEPSKYTELKRIDWPGNDLGTAMTTKTLTACDAACDSNPVCKGFFASLPGGQPDRCWLKSAFGQVPGTKISPGAWNDGSFFVKPGQAIPMIS